MIREILGQTTCFVGFLVMGIYSSAVEQFSDIISSCYLLFSYGYWFLLDWVFSAKDLAVHKKKFAKVPKPANYVRPKRTGVGTVVAIWLSGFALECICSVKGWFPWYIPMMMESGLFALNSWFIRKTCWLGAYIMKNKNSCCKNCTINSWDYAFFVTPLLAAPRIGPIFQVVRTALVTIGFSCFFLWEFLYHKYPWRFYADTNKELSCARCGKKCELIYRSDKTAARS